MDENRWPSALVMVSLVVAVTAIEILAIARYDTADEALQIFSALGPLVGVITGAGALYFFTRPVIERAQQQAQREARRADENAGALTAVAAELPAGKLGQIKEDVPVVARALGEESPEESAPPPAAPAGRGARRPAARSGTAAKKRRRSR